jgi:hypothetical protein
MIYAVALTVLLASSAAGASPTTLSKMMKKSAAKKIHEHKVADLVRAVQAVPRKAIAADFDKRVLLDNSGFLNFAYSSDGSCAEDPYEYAGLGMGSCIQDDGSSGGSYMIACTGPDTAINITYVEYTNGDCTGTPTTSNFVTDGTCGVSTNADDDKWDLDDRVNFQDDDFLSNLRGEYGSYSYTCAASKLTNTGIEYSAYNDDSCDVLTGYYGLNVNACIPTGYETVHFTINSNCDATFYSDNTCDTVMTSDDGDDDGDDDDDNTDPQNTCNVWGDDDDNFGQYYSYFVFDCSNDGDDDTCFAGSETVLLESGVTKAISDVEVGDVVQVVSADGSLAFSEVVFLPHGANTQKATFSDLQLASGNSLRATPAHFVLAGACGADAFELTAMKDVAEGSCVQTANGEDEVTGSGIVVDHGIYTVVTKESSGLVVVNGIRASSFAHNHWLVNNYYNIHRAVYEVAPSLMKNRDVIAANLIVGDIALSL